MWKEIQDLQKELDDVILEKHNLTMEGTDISRFIAAMVEFGEFLNEVEDFKFWKTKKKNNREAMLEEAVDMVHFLVSLSNHLGMDLEDEMVKTRAAKMVAIEQGHFDKPETIEAYTISTFNAMGAILQGLGPVIALIDLVEMLELIGFSEEDILVVYRRKCAVNHERQENNY